jgi:transposase-like protein
VVLYLGSASARGGWVSMAIGIEAQGCKHVLGLWPGCMAEAAVSRMVLAELTARGLAPRPALLVVSDGAAASDQALQGAFGSSALIAHCRERVRQEVAGHLAERARGALQLRLRQAWSLSASEASAALRDLLEQLRYEHPGAAARLQRSLDATLTVARLGLPAQLASHLEIGGPVRVAVEEATKAARAGTGMAAVKAGLPAVIERMRRLIGYQALPLLMEKLEAYAAGGER